MRNKRVLCAALAMALALCATACTEEGSSDVSSAEDSSSQVTTVSEESSSQSETATTTTTTSTTTTTTTTSETTAAPTETQSTTAPRTPPEVITGKDLKAYVNSVYKATDITKDLAAAEDPGDRFEEITDKPGQYALTASMKTADLFDPFEDLIYQQKRVATVKADAQCFVLVQTFESLYDYEGKTKKYTSAEGYIAAVGFNCASADEAKKVYAAVVTDDVKKQVAKDTDVAKYEIGADYAIIKLKDLNGYLCYYLVDNNVFALECMEYGMGPHEKPTDPNYKKAYNYSAEFEKLCKAMGVKKLASSVK